MTWFPALMLTLAPAPPPTSSDVAAARDLFERNLDAIRRRDKAAYLACYWKSEKLARTGANGIDLGYAAHEKSAGENWPDTFDASDLELVAMQPGVVFRACRRCAWRSRVRAGRACGGGGSASREAPAYRPRDRTG